MVIFQDGGTDEKPQRNDLSKLDTLKFECPQLLQLHSAFNALHWFQWFMMVVHHWSNDGMVQYQCRSLAEDKAMAQL